MRFLKDAFSVLYHCLSIELVRSSKLFTEEGRLMFCVRLHYQPSNKSHTEAKSKPQDSRHSLNTKFSVIHPFLRHKNLKFGGFLAVS